MPKQNVLLLFEPDLLSEDDQQTKPEKSRRKPTALLKKKAVTTSFIEISSRLGNGKRKTAGQNVTCFTGEIFEASLKHHSVAAYYT